MSISPDGGFRVNEKAQAGCIPAPGHSTELPTLQYAGHVPHPKGIAAMSAMKRPLLNGLFEYIRILCEGLLDLAVHDGIITHESRF
jgi:hypothetical protein